jgi:hypothetical protein
MSILNLTTKKLRKIINLKVQIEKLGIKLEKLAGGGSGISASSTSNTAPKKRRKMSKAVRAKMALAAKLRWAKRKGTVKPAKKKGGMSAAGRARVSAAAKLRWKKAKAAGKTRL